MNFLSNDFIVISLFALCVFVVTYLKIDSILQFFYEKTAGTREEVLDLMEKMLIETNQKRVTVTLLLMSVGLGLAFFLLFWPNIIMGVIIGMAVTMAGWNIPKSIMKNMWHKRCSTIGAQMVDGMTIMANGVKSGLSIPQSMERIVDNMNGPIAQEFQLILNKLRLGLSTEEALNEFADRIPIQDVQMFVTSVNILMEVGGNLAETFVTISFTIRERQKIHRKIEALTQASKTQGMIIAGVPFLLIGAFAFLDPDFIKPLFTSPLGWFCLALMIGLQLTGGYLMKKIVTIKV